MVEQKETLTRGGIYLAKLNPSKASEIGKVRPVIILNAQIILDSIPSVVFVCPLSSQSHVEFSSLHFEITPRDSLETISYALVEHCRSISIVRVIYPRIAQTTNLELEIIVRRLQRLLGH